MRIEALTSFKDGSKSFVKGDIVTISDEDGIKYCAHGWTKDITGQVLTQEQIQGPITLNIHNVKMGHTAEKL